MSHHTKKQKERPFNHAVVMAILITKLTSVINKTKTLLISISDVLI